jgi:ABC-type molybdate transport system substrate-binding protein
LIWLALAGTILTVFQAFAAGEASETSPSTALVVAAAADLKFALDNLVAEFEVENPVTKVNVTYGSSGNFFAQTQEGAPFDLFFSADIGYPRKLAEAGLGADEVFAVAPQMRGAGRFWEVPLAAYSRMEQGGVILKSTKNLKTARAFRDFVLGDHGCEVLKRYGFFLPEK